MFNRIRNTYSANTVNGTALRMGSIIITVCLVMVIIAAGATVAEDSHTPNATTAHSPRTCFRAAKWTGEDGYRPCVQVLQVEEDGSFSFRVSDAGGIDAPATTRYISGVGALDR